MESLVSSTGKKNSQKVVSSYLSVSAYTHIFPLNVYIQASCSSYLEYIKLMFFKVILYSYFLIGFYQVNKAGGVR